MDERCGSAPGFRAHRTRKEEPCAPCREAQAVYTQERRTCGCGGRKAKESAAACPRCLATDWTRVWRPVGGVLRLDVACLPERLRETA